MSRKLVLVAVWSLIIGVMVLAGVLVGPELLARFYISRLTPSGTPAADAALRRLQHTGRWAVPCLIEAAHERDPSLAEIRAGNAPDFHRESDMSIHKFHDLRKASPMESRADLCVGVLAAHWNRGLLTEHEQRRLLRYLHWGSIHTIAASTVFPVSGRDLGLYVQFNYPVHGGAEPLWVQRRVALVVQESAGERIIPGVGLLPSGNSDPMLPADIFSSNPSIGPTTTCLSVHSQSFSWPLRPADLGVGKHALCVRVWYGPTTKTALNQPEESPWYEEFTYGPLEVEIVPATENQAQE